MPEVSEQPRALSAILEEFKMSPARDQHNEFVYEITAMLNQSFKGKNLIAKFDTFRYLEDWQVHAFGDFKNAVGLEKFIGALGRFGANKTFIQKKLDDFSAFGAIPPAYAPDVLIVEKTERHNRFSVPLLTMEIISESSRLNDGWFMPCFYETIGVQEFFVGETEEEAGRIVRGYRLHEGRYQMIIPGNEGYFSDIIGDFLPAKWEL